MSDRELVISPELENMFGKLERLCWLDGEDCLLGKVKILGVDHFVTFVRVTPSGKGPQRGTNDPHNRLDAVLSGADCAGETVVLPGFEGEWVVGVDPYRD